MWLESKLIELNMVGETQTAYKIAFGQSSLPFTNAGTGLYDLQKLILVDLHCDLSVLDRTPMFSVYSVRHGKPFKHEVKVDLLGCLCTAVLIRPWKGGLNVLTLNSCFRKALEIIWRKVRDAVSFGRSKTN